MKIVTWNVNGLRAILGKGFADFLAREKPDALCLQEIKAKPEQVDSEFPGYRIYWNPAERPGYSGTALLSREEPLSVETRIGESAADSEGRVLTAEYPSFFLVNTYVPNVGRELGRLDYRVKVWGPAYRDHLARLAAKKPVVFCGDMNVAHEPIDLARPKQNVGNAGFTDEERQDFREILGRGFVDSFRVLCPDPGHYTWWSYRSGAREKNIGWRIDYVGVSESLRPQLKSAAIYPHVGGSDHCPASATIGPGACKK